MLALVVALLVITLVTITTVLVVALLIVAGLAILAWLLLAIVALLVVALVAIATGLVTVRALLLITFRPLVVATALLLIALVTLLIASIALLLLAVALVAWLITTFLFVPLALFAAGLIGRCITLPFRRNAFAAMAVLAWLAVGRRRSSRRFRRFHHFFWRIVLFTLFVIVALFVIIVLLVILIGGNGLWIFHRKHLIGGGHRGYVLVVTHEGWSDLFGLFPFGRLCFQDLGDQVLFLQGIGLFQIQLAGDLLQFGELHAAECGLVVHATV